MTLPFIFENENESLYEVRTNAKGPTGTLPLTAQMLEDSPSGDLFGLSQNV